MTIVCRASLLGVALCSLVSTQVLSYNRDPVYKSVVFFAPYQFHTNYTHDCFLEVMSNQGRSVVSYYNGLFRLWGGRIC